MAAEGMKLTSFYAAPVCTPSRAQMMTGCYAKRVSMPNVIFPACPIGHQRQGTHRGRAAQAAGLRHDGHRQMAPGRPAGIPADAARLRPLPRPALLQRHGRRTASRDAQEATARPPLPLVRDERGDRSPGRAGQAHRAATPRKRSSSSRANKDRPFFLYLPHTAVHVPLHPGKAFQGKSANGTYGDWVEEVDWSVGRVLDTLRELKLDERTLVLFTSDNGPWLIKGKEAAWPGRCAAARARPGKAACASRPSPGGRARSPPARSCDAPMSEMDVLPTLVKLAGGDGARRPQDRRQGHLAAAVGPDASSRRTRRCSTSTATGWRPSAPVRGSWPSSRRPKRHARRRQPQAGKHLHAALYNLDTDIGETDRRRRPASRRGRSGCRGTSSRWTGIWAYGFRPRGPGPRQGRAPATAPKARSDRVRLSLSADLPRGSWWRLTMRVSCVLMWV